MRLVNVNNRLWAVGFVWPLDAGPQSARSRSRTVLRQKAHGINPAFNKVTFRSRQYGFCAGGGHDLSKVRSLAGFLTLSSPSFLGVFHLRDVTGSAFWWLFCRHHGRNIGTGDTAYDTREEAEGQAQSLRALLKDDFADNITCATPAESLAWLSDLLKPGLVDAIKGTARLESLHKPPSRPAIPLLAACLAIGAGIWGAAKYFDHRSMQAASESARLSRLSAEQRRRAVQARPEQHFPQEWMTKPRPEALIAQCAAAMRSQPLVVNGWLLEALSCADGSLELAWRHQPGADYLALPEHAVMHEQDPLLAAASRPLPVLAGRRDGQAFPAILSKEQATRELYHLCQIIGVQLRLSFAKPATRAIDKVEIAAPWVRADFEFTDVPTLLLGDPDFARMLSIPGLTLESIRYTNNSFVYKGSVYVRTR
jgi:hypothetical protein